MLNKSKFVSTEHLQVPQALSAVCYNSHVSHRHCLICVKWQQQQQQQRHAVSLHNQVLSDHFYFFRCWWCWGTSRHLTPLQAYFMFAGAHCSFACCSLVCRARQPTAHSKHLPRFHRSVAVVGFY
jgi:hypothetical protein